MFKKIALVSTVTVLASFTSTASAADNAIGFQFRVPFTVSTDSNIKNSNANSILLSFFMDQETEVGILSEQYTFKDNSAGGTATGMDVNALRVSKNLAIGPIPVYVGLDLGQMNVLSAAGSLGSTNMADLFGGIKLLSSKGKVTSFLGVEVAYRMAKAELAGTGIKNYGGLGLNLSAGLNF